METNFGENEIEEGQKCMCDFGSDAKRLFGTDDVVGMNLDIICMIHQNLFASWV